MGSLKINTYKKEQRPLRKVIEIHEEEGFDLLICGHKYTHTKADAARIKHEKRPKSRRCDNCPLNLEMEDG